MTSLPQVTATKLLRALARAGSHEVHRKGSHVTLVHREDSTRIAAVPVHKGRTLRPGTLRAILRGSRLGVDELLALL